MPVSQKAKNKYNRDNYYNIGVMVPKRYKEEIKAAAAARGVSVSRMITDLLGRELGLDLALTSEPPNWVKSREKADGKNEDAGQQQNEPSR